MTKEPMNLIPGNKLCTKIATQVHLKTDIEYNRPICTVYFEALRGTHVNEHRVL